MEIGIFGMNEMGKNLAINFYTKGVIVRGYDKDASEIGDKYMIAIFNKIKYFIESLETPRKILILDSGKSLTSTVKKIRKYTEDSDIIVDCTDSHYKKCVKLGIECCGIIGGIRGALLGPSMVYGGSREKYKKLAPVLKKIVTRYTPIIKSRDTKLFFDTLGEGLLDVNLFLRDVVTCCKYMGTGGAGQYVKMVFAGIEFSMLQIVAEIKAISGDMLLVNKKVPSYLLEVGEVVEAHPERIRDVQDKLTINKTVIWCLTESAKITSCPVLAASVLFRVSTADPQRHPEGRDEATSLGLSNECISKAYRVSLIVAYLEAVTLITKKIPDINIEDLFDVWKGGRHIWSCVLEATEQMAAVKEVVFEEDIYLRKVVTKAIKAKIAVPALTACMESIDSWRSDGTAAFIGLMLDFLGNERAVLKNGQESNYTW